MGVASNYIGIIGSQGHTSIYGENNEYKNQNTNTEVKEESDNYTLRDQVANGTIYRKRDFKLNTGETIEVHEYPLLYLGDLSSGIGAAGYSAYYARRVDGGSYSVGESWLPASHSQSVVHRFRRKRAPKGIYFGLSGQLILIIRVKPFRYGRPRRLDRNAQRSIRILPLK